MSARTFTEQRAQYGKEVTAGTAVACPTRFSAAALTIGPAIETERVRTSGEYFDSLVYAKRDTSEGTIEGTPTFDDTLADMLELVFGTPTVTEVEAGKVNALGYALSADRNTWTVQYGDASDASEATGVFAKSLELTWGANSGDSKITVGLVGGALLDGKTLTAGALAPTPVPVLADNVRVFIDDDQDSLGSTPLAGGLSTTLKIDNIAELVKYFGSSDTVNTVPDATVELVSVADLAGRGFLADLRTSKTRYVRIEATGPAIRGAAGNAASKLTIDLAVQGENHERGEEDSVFAATNTLRLVKDGAGFSHAVTLVTAA